MSRKCEWKRRMEELKKLWNESARFEGYEEEGFENRRNNPFAIQILNAGYMRIIYECSKHR